MKITEIYSHLNGYEYLQFHKPKLWEEIKQVITSIDAYQCLKKISKEKTKIGKLLYSPREINKKFANALNTLGWNESKVQYWVTANQELVRRTMHLCPDEQKKEIEEAGKVPIKSYNQTDFVKDRIAIEVQLGKYAFVAYDLFVKHLAFYVGNTIDLGIEILPMKCMQAKMSSGPGYYEGELYNILRQGRGVPAVPLIIIGIEP